MDNTQAAVNYHNSLPAKRAYHSDNSDGVIRMLANKSMLARDDND